MSMVTYPLNDIEYTAEDAELFHSTRTSGVFANNSFDYLISGEDNTIVIGPGIAWIKNSEFSGKVVANKEQETLVLDLPDANYPRIDAVVIRFSANENGSTIIAKPGVASSSPVPPSVVRTESVYELHLFQILRNPADTAISPANITDVRLDNNYCGIMADSVTQVDTEAIEAQISELIGNLRDEISEVEDGSAWWLKTDQIPFASLNWANPSYVDSSGETVWLMPPMVGGVEYRIPERYQGMPVYVQIFNCGECPVDGGKSVEHGVSNAQPISISGITESSGYLLPFVSGSSGNGILISATPLLINIFSQLSTRNHGTVYALMKYYKITE